MEQVASSREVKTLGAVFDQDMSFSYFLLWIFPELKTSYSGFMLINYSMYFLL